MTRLLLFGCLCYGLHCVAADQPAAPAEQATSNVGLPAANNSAPGYKWLSDLPAENASVGFGEFGKGGVFGGVKSLHGLNMHADASVEYALDKQFRAFRGTAAMNDTAQTGPERAVVFQVFGDGQLLWESAPLRQKLDYQECLLDITGVSRLRLTAIYDPNRTGHGNEAHSVWMEPRVDRHAADPAVLKLFDAAAVRQAREALELKQAARDLFLQNNYEKLEQLAAGQRKTPRSFQGQSSLSLVYEAIEAPISNAPAHWQQHFESFKRWRSQHPDAITPYCAEAGARMEYALLARGTGLPNTVKPEAAKLFQTRMADAVAVLDQGEKQAARDVRFWHMRLRAAGLAGTRDSAIENFEKAIAAEPQYNAAYTAVAEALQPRWQGRPGDLEKLAAQTRAKLGGPQGDVAYGLMACTAASFAGEQVFDHTLFEYAQVKPCLEALVQQFPQNQFVVQHAALLAFAARDQQFARTLFQVVGLVACKPNVWTEAMRFEGARTWALDTQPAQGRLRVLSMHQDVKSIAFSPDATRLFAAGPVSNEVRAWDPRSGELSDTWYLERPLAVAVHPQESKIVVGGGNDQPTPSPLLVSCDFDSTVGPQPMPGHAAPVIALQFSADGKLLASGSNDRTARIWDWNTHTQRIELPHSDAVGGVAFSPDAQRLATLTRAGEVRVWDLRKSPSESAVLGSVGNPGNGLAWSHDGTQIIAVGGKNSFKAWDAKTGTAYDVNVGRPLARTVAISTAGDLIAFGLESAQLDIVDSRQRTRITTFPHWSKLRSVAFSPDGNMVAGSSYDGSVHLWDLKGLRPK